MNGACSGAFGGCSGEGEEGKGVGQCELLPHGALHYRQRRQTASPNPALRVAANRCINACLAPYMGRNRGIIIACGVPRRSVQSTATAESASHTSHTGIEVPSPRCGSATVPSHRLRASSAQSGSPSAPSSRLPALIARN